MQALPPEAARAVLPRAASTTLVLRDGAQGLEVLMVKRSPNASFMPGAYVFPGGAVDAADATSPCDETQAQLTQRIGTPTGVGMQALAYVAAAIRECREECNLDLGSSLGLQPWSHWVTPLGVPKRFDTLFFVARAPVGQVPKPDEGETTTLEWIAPQAALNGHAAGSFPMEFATVATVRSLLPFAKSTVEAVLQRAASQHSLPAMHPRLKLDSSRQVLGVLLPGQAGYEDLAGDGR